MIWLLFDIPDILVICNMEKIEESMLGIAGKIVQKVYFSFVQIIK